MYIRTRLALWFMLILSVVLTAFSVTIYQLTKNNLLTEIDTDVRQRAAMLNIATHPYPQETTMRVPKLDVFASPDIYLQVLDRHGRALASSGNLGNRTLPLMRDAITADQVREARVGSTLLFVYGQAVLVHHKLLGYVLVACSPRRIYFALDRLLHILIPGVIVALVLAGIAIWLLVRQAMHPLEHLATTAADIAAAGDHSRRLSPQGPPDEINRLAHTINGMLQALEEVYQQIQDAYQQVQKISDLQRHFLIDISYELRMPLTIMLSSLDLIRRVGATDPDFQAHSLEHMRLEAERMARMVAQLLILARSDTAVAAAHEPVLLEDIVLALYCYFTIARVGEIAVEMSPQPTPSPISLVPPLLDPIIALVVAANIIWTGARLPHETGLGLLDTALPKEDLQHINAILDDYRAQGMVFHALRSRQAGSRRFVSFHVLVPGTWAVWKGHSMCEAIELALRHALPETTVFTHLEPREDPTSFVDQALDRVPEPEEPSETAPALEERPCKHETIREHSLGTERT